MLQFSRRTQEYFLGFLNTLLSLSSSFDIEYLFDNKKAAMDHHMHTCRHRVRYHLRARLLAASFMRTAAVARVNIPDK